MECPNCQTVNPAGAKFCANCGTQLAITCPQCGATQPTGAKFCNNCGNKLAAATETRPPAAMGQLDRFIPKELLRKLEAARESGQMVGERRVVTMLFCDVKGSTAAAAHFDPEEWAEIINGAFARMIEPIYHYEGTVARLMGDGLLAFFGAPIAHEDDPQRAVLAGLEIVAGIRSYREEMRRQWGIDLDVRVGANTGLVVVGAVGSDQRMEYSALGDAINMAARMEQTAPPGTVQIAEPTYRLVAPLFDVDVVDGLVVKGVTEPVRAYRVRGRRTNPGSLRGIAGLASPLVGRRLELGRLVSALDGLTTGQGHIVSILGEAGLGKSRLVAEARRATDPAALRWIEGKSQSYETAVPYAPFAVALADSLGLEPALSGEARYERLREAIEQVLPGRADELAPFLAQPMALPIPDADAERVQYLEPPMLRGMVFGAVAAWFEALAVERPTVLYLDDVHWIDPTSLELLQSLLPIAGHAPLLFLLAFRPRRDDPSWRLHETTAAERSDLYAAIHLRPLEETQGRELVANLLTIEDLPEPVRQLIVDRAEGNPFFLEETIRSLLDAGLVVQQDGHFRATADIVKLQVPDTLVGVITARLDRLADADRQVIQAAAVLGRNFTLNTLGVLLDQPLSVNSSLLTLQRRELIRQTSAHGFTFKHGMTQEAAYNSLLLSRRRQLHHRAADALLQLAPDQAADIARHYLEARQPAQALPHLVAAGRQAAHAFAMQEAIGYFTQALAHEALGDTATARAIYEGMGSLQGMSDPVAATSLYERMLAAAEERGDTPMTISALNKLSSTLALMMGQFERAEQYLNRAEGLSQSAGDPDGFAELSIVRCQMCTMQADFESVVRYMDGVIDSSLNTGNEHNLALGLGHTVHSLLSLGRFDEAWQKAVETLTLARQIGDRAHEADMLTYPIPWLYARNGDLEETLTAARQGVELARRIGSLSSIAQGEWMTAEAYRLRGEYEDALAAGQRAVEAATPLEPFMPFYLVIPLGTLGSTYLEVSDRFHDRIAELHRHALRLLEVPLGAVGGASAWANLGWCALALGDVEMAGQLFTSGMETPNMMTMMEMPRYLAGMALVRLAQGDGATALRLAEEAFTFATTRKMKHQTPLIRLTLGRVLAAQGEHERALAEFDRATDDAARMTLRPMLWMGHGSAARSLRALGRDEQAAQTEAKAQAAVDSITGLLNEPELREAYRQSAARRLATLMAP